eukprot:TRINITY_DN4463_c5_g1_i1.p1 TRINITY_DN4463_c5_g1~~TRINITY_DN4463_c5_g1_i1.p1  ORF type:complete len:451 (+),score=73.88 TRINITY_DN4463_c5_g1_i1:139-1491(+)
MDFAWPMSGSRGGYENPEPAGREQTTAVDFMVSAWSLFRGHGGDEGPSIASASLAAAGGGSPEKDVDFVKHVWALYQQAMDEGWVTEWVEKFTTPDIFLSDSIGRAGAYTCNGREDVCTYYNTVLKKVWDNGNATITWTPRSFYSMGKGTGVVMAEFDVDVVPKGHTHPRQLWACHVQGGRLSEVRMYPLASMTPPGHPRTAAPTPAVQSPSPSTSPTPSPTASLHPPVPSLTTDTSDTASCISMPSLAESIRSGPVGVALTRPCSHNSWDNVRIKRGWAILRCRICQSQWRLRPTTIPHCGDFARGAGCCPAGVDCHQLHVHRTRESSEMKRQLQQQPVPTPFTSNPAAAVFSGDGEQQQQQHQMQRDHSQAAVLNTSTPQDAVSPYTAPKPLQAQAQAAQIQSQPHTSGAKNRSFSEGVPSSRPLAEAPQQAQQAVTYEVPYHSRDLT